MKRLFIAILLIATACGKDDVQPQRVWKFSLPESFDSSIPGNPRTPPISASFSINRKGNYYTVLKGGTFTFDGRAYTTIDDVSDEIVGNVCHLRLINFIATSGEDYSSIQFTAEVLDNEIKASGAIAIEKINSRVNQYYLPLFIIK